MAKKAPGKAHREGLTVVQLMDIASSSIRSRTNDWASARNAHN